MQGLDQLPNSVIITEVGPRDGLQSEVNFIPTQQKIALIEGLIEAGVQSFEVSSFVSSRAVPQMADAQEVIAALRPYRHVEFSALVPNLQGAMRALHSGIDAMVVFLSASNSHNMKNLNRSTQQSLFAVGEISTLAQSHGIGLHAAISTAFGCPFEGEVSELALRDIALRLRDAGITRISLGDTTGMATPPLVTQRVNLLREAIADIDLTLHFHNTRGVGLACVYAGLQQGIRRYEASIGGLGGCPFVPNATGNICTEDLVYLLEEMGIKTNMDLDKLIVMAHKAQTIVGHSLPGQVMKAGPRLRRYSMEDAKTAHG